MKLVSVIIPIFNVEQYLQKCVQSVQNQTYTNLEIFLVNDGSTDKCGKMVDEIAVQDSRIKVIHKPNGGLSSARNAALDKASGAYILFVDADDWIELDMIESMVHEMEQHEAELVVCDYTKVYEDKIEKNFLKMKQEQIDIGKLGLKGYLYEYFFNYKHGDEVCNKLYKNVIIKKYHIRFEPNSEVFSEDKLFNLYYLVHIKTIISTNSSFYYYLQRNGSLMRQPKPEIIEQYLNLAEKYIDYLKRNNSNMTSIYSILVFHLFNSSLKNYVKSGASISQITAAIDKTQNRDIMQIMTNLKTDKEVIAYCQSNRTKLLTPLFVKIYAVCYTLKFNLILAYTFKNMMK